MGLWYFIEKNETNERHLFEMVRIELKNTLIMFRFSYLKQEEQSLIFRLNCDEISAHMC